MKQSKQKGKLFSILTSKLFAAIMAFTITTLFGWEAGAATILIGLNTGDGDGDGDGDGTALGGGGDGSGDGGGGDGGDGDGDGSGDTPWTDGMSDDLKSYFGESKSLEEFKTAQPKATEVPETYAVPEGIEGVDEEVVAGFSAFAKENKLNISQDDFAKLIEFDAQRMGGLPDQILAQADASMKEGLATMKTEMGDEKYNESLQMARKVIKAYGNEAFNARLEATRWGNDPEMLKFIAWAGPHFSEDTFAGGDGGGSGEKKSQAQKMYPNQGK